jgi:hypothetical protein
MYGYQLENRAVSEQVLNLSTYQVEGLYGLLEDNLQPAKKNYRYQFYADNCTTRIYQLLARALDGEMQRATSYRQEPQSYRQLFTPYLKNFPWVRLGMNIGLGLETDQKTSFKQSLYLPATLEALNHSYHAKQPLVREVNTLFAPSVDIPQTSSFSITPFLFSTILALFILGISIREYVKGFSVPFLDYLIFGFIGLVGLVLMLLWSFSLHTPTYQNLNLLWLSPLHILFLFSYQRWRQISKCYSL